MDAFLVIFGAPACGALVYLLTFAAESWGREARSNQWIGSVKNRYRIQHYEFDSSAWTGR